MIKRVFSIGLTAIIPVLCIADPVAVPDTTNNPAAANMNEPYRLWIGISLIAILFLMVLFVFKKRKQL
ncbi:MAG TPA: hypothetical protein PL045_01730 [Chitinophagaceae bacterium]|nr:hypothetical protein [Chitinophagaceae bacterium]